MLLLSHWLLTDLGLFALHDVKRAFRPGGCYDSAQAGLSFSVLLSTKKRQDLTKIMLIWPVEMASPDKSGSMAAFGASSNDVLYRSRTLD